MNNKATGSSEAVLSPGAHYIRISTRCNNNCIFCNVDRTEHHDPQTVARTITDIPPSAAEVVITGGEPTIDKNLFKYIRMISEVAPRAHITVQTNGMMCRYADYVEKLRGAGVSKAIVSVPACDQATYESLTGGSFEHFETGLSNLAQSPLSLVLNCLVHAKNFKCLPAAAEWITTRFSGSLSVCVSTLIPMGRMQNRPDLFVKYSDAAPMIEDFVDILTRQGVPLMICGMYGFPPCVLGRLAQYSETLTYLNPNCHGELGEQEFAKPESCANCRLDNICLGVWKAYADTFGFDELKPEPYSTFKYPRLEPVRNTGAVERFTRVVDAIDQGRGLAGSLVVWSVTDTCNCHCEMCASKGHGGALTEYLTMDRIGSVIRELRALGFEKILFCGGEPTLVRALPDIVMRAKEAGFTVFMNTNGSGTESMYDALIEAGVDCIVFSLDSAEPGVHDRIRGMPGLHARVLSRAALASAATGPHGVRLHAVVMKENYRGLERMVDMATQAGAGGLDFTLVSNAKGGCNRDRRMRRSEVEEFYGHIAAEILTRALHEKISVHFNPLPVEWIALGEDMKSWLDAPPLTPGQSDPYARGCYNRPYFENHICSSPFRNLTIEFNGDVHPCAQSAAIVNEFRVDNVNNRSLEEIWNCNEFVAFRQKSMRHHVCENCSSFSWESHALDNIIHAPQLALMRIIGGWNPLL